MSSPNSSSRSTPDFQIVDILCEEDMDTIESQSSGDTLQAKKSGEKRKFVNSDSPSKSKNMKLESSEQSSSSSQSTQQSLSPLESEEIFSVDERAYQGDDDSSIEKKIVMQKKLRKIRKKKLVPSISTSDSSISEMLESVETSFSTEKDSVTGEEFFSSVPSPSLMGGPEFIDDMEHPIVVHYLPPPPKPLEENKNQQQHPLSQGSSSDPKVTMTVNSSNEENEDPNKIAADNEKIKDGGVK